MDRCFPFLVPWIDLALLFATLSLHCTSARAGHHGLYATPLISSRGHYFTANQHAIDLLP
jgi:hypothetical protein